MSSWYLFLDGRPVVAIAYPARGKKPADKDAVPFAPDAYLLTADSERKGHPREYDSRRALEHVVSGIRRYAPQVVVEIVPLPPKERPMKRIKKNASNDPAFAVTATMTPENPPPPDVPLERARYREKLPVAINEAIAFVASNELARVIVERASFLEARKAQNAKARERRAHYDEAIEELGAKINKRTEMKEVECIEYLDPMKKEIFIVRQDTAEIVSRRPAEADDMQETLLDGTGKPIVGASPKKRKKGDKAEPEPPFGDMPIPGALVDRFLEDQEAPL